MRAVVLCRIEAAIDIEQRDRRLTGYFHLLHVARRHLCYAARIDPWHSTPGQKYVIIERVYHFNIRYFCRVKQRLPRSALRLTINAYTQIQEP